RTRGDAGGAQGCASPAPHRWRRRARRAVEGDRADARAAGVRVRDLQLAEARCAPLRGRRDHRACSGGRFAPRPEVEAAHVRGCSHLARSTSRQRIPLPVLPPVVDLVRFNRNENVGVAHCSWDEFAAWRDAVCAPSEPDAAISYLWSLPCPQRDDRYGIDNTWADNAPAIGDQGVGLWGASEWCIWAFTLPPGGLPSDGQGGAWRADGTYG